MWPWCLLVLMLTEVNHHGKMSVFVTDGFTCDYDPADATATYYLLLQ